MPRPSRFIAKPSRNPRWERFDFAQRLTAIALTLGMKRGPCEACGAEERGGKRPNIHGHHDSYLEPLRIRWLCDSCHKRWHSKNGAGKGRNAPITLAEKQTWLSRLARQRVNDAPAEGAA